MGLEFSIERIYGFTFAADELTEKPASILEWVDELPTHRWPQLVFNTAGNSWTGKTFGFASAQSFYDYSSIDTLEEEREGYILDLEASPTKEELEQLKDFALYATGYELSPKASVVMSLF